MNKCICIFTFKKNYYNEKNGNYNLKLKLIELTNTFIIILLEAQIIKNLFKLHKEVKKNCFKLFPQNIISI